MEAGTRQEPFLQGGWEWVRGRTRLCASDMTCKLQARQGCVCAG